MSNALRESALHRKMTGDIETLENLIAITKTKENNVLSDQQMDPTIKEIELQRLRAIDAVLAERKETKEREKESHNWDTPLTVEAKLPINNNSRSQELI